jgi:hypothetical protein
MTERIARFPVAFLQDRFALWLLSRLLVYGNGGFEGCQADFTAHWRNCRYRGPHPRPLFWRRRTWGCQPPEPNMETRAFVCWSVSTAALALLYSTALHPRRSPSMSKIHAVTPKIGNVGHLHPHSSTEEVDSKSTNGRSGRSRKPRERYLLSPPSTNPQGQLWWNVDELPNLCRQRCLVSSWLWARRRG